MNLLALMMMVIGPWSNLHAIEPNPAPVKSWIKSIEGAYSSFNKNDLGFRSKAIIKAVNEDTIVLKYRIGGQSNWQHYRYKCYSHKRYCIRVYVTGTNYPFIPTRNEDYLEFTDDRGFVTTVYVESHTSAGYTIESIDTFYRIPYRDAL